MQYLNLVTLKKKKKTDFLRLFKKREATYKLLNSKLSHSWIPNKVLPTNMYIILPFFQKKDGCFVYFLTLHLQKCSFDREWIES